MIVYLDANCVIYFVEQNPTWYPKVAARLAAARAAGDTIATSDLTAAEALVLPYRKPDPAAEADFEAFLADPDITVFPISRAVNRRSARLRATFASLKLPDALHLAAVIEAGCGLFLTADARLARCTAITVEVLT